MKTTKDMDFIIGIFVGMGLMFGLGIYLNNKDKKKAEDERTTAQVNAWLRANDIRFDPPPYIATAILERKLEDAIDREDYAAAARLRDLINKK